MVGRGDLITDTGKVCHSSAILVTSYSVLALSNAPPVVAGIRFPMCSVKVRLVSLHGNCFSQART